MNSDFYNDQKAVISPSCSVYIAVTDEICKRQEEREREGLKRGKMKRRKEHQEDATRLWNRIKSL